MLVWLGVVTGGINLWGFWWWSPWVAALAPIMIAGGLAGMAYTWLVSSPRTRSFQGVTLGAVIVAMVFPQSVEINTRSFYSTDSAAFDHVAARALSYGLDPYVASMTGVARLLRIPAHFWTYTASGGHVTQFSYPAGSFLLALPATALGVHMPVDWTDLAAWIVTVVLVFAMVPAPLRWLAALLGLTPFFVGSFSSGGTDALFLPFLVVAVWRWDRFGHSEEPGLSRWIGPVALGLACAIKQAPWFAVPFLVTGVILETRLRSGAPLRTGLRYVLTILVTFATVNLPFAAWRPAAWWHGTLIPLAGGLVADGQGLVTIATHGVTAGVDLQRLTMAGALAMVVVVAAFVTWYPRLKRIWPVLLTIPVFFSPRSLSSYLVDLVPVALIAALSVEDARREVIEPPTFSRRFPLRPSALVASVACVGVVVASLMAFSAPPLRLTVRSVITSHAGTELGAVTLSVVNETSRWLVPHFLVNAATSQNYEGFWTRAKGGVIALGPHRSETVTLVPPAQVAAPRRGAGWLVEAYTADPTWLSSSSLLRFTPR